jgi:hypothetical protein
LILFFQKAKEHEQYLVANGYAERVVKAVAGYYCTSEDEGPVMDDNGYVLRKGRPYFEIKQVPGRSQLVTDFIRIIDREIEQRGTPGSIVEGSSRRG